ncbi:MAG: serine/threonine-protein kinase [Myxococcota bacterium]
MNSRESSSPSSVALVLREISTTGIGQPAAARKPGARIGRYVLERPLEEAGVGALYAAHDGKLDRKVALRLIPATDDDGTPYSRARLLRETRSMARMSHPNVIRIFDVGATRRELFIAMELLDGESVEAWIARVQPAWTEVLAAFVQAGRGLAAAHDAGFVHGDFEPRYVQRTDTGRVVVTDFGLTRARTRADGLTNPGTDTRLVRDDHYSFCTALYEALFHEPAPMLTPDFESRPAIRDSDVPRRVVRALARGLSRDHRFPSMKALLTALEHPRKRNLLLGSAAAVVFIGGAAGAYALAGLGDAPASCATDGLPPTMRDESRPALVESLARAQGDYAADTAGLVGRSLDAWSTAWRDARTRACDSGEREPSPCMRRLATLAGALTDSFATADARTLEFAAEAVSQLPAPAACETQPWLTAPYDADFEATWSTAWASLVTGHPDVAVAQLQPLQRDVQSPTDELRTLVLLGEAQAEAGSNQAAARTLSQALGRDAAPAPRMRVRAALALAHVQIDRLDRPVQARDTMLVARDSLDDIGQAPLLRARMMALGARVQVSESALDKARTELADAEASLKEQGDAARLYATELAVALGALEVEAGRYDAAMDHYRRAQRERTEMLGLSHPRVAEALSEVAGAWIGQGELVAARDTLETAASILENAYEPDHPKMLRLRGRLALLLGLTGRDDASFAMFEDVIAMQSKRNGENSDIVADLLTNRGALYIEAGRLQDANADLDRALSIRRVLGDDDGQSAVLSELANIALRQDDPARAETLARQSIKLRPKHQGEDHPMLSPALVIIGRAIAAQSGREAEARETFERALEVTRNAQGPDHFNLAYPLAGLGRLDAAAGKHKRAAEQLTRAIALLEQASFGAELEMATRIDLAQSQWDAGKKDQARKTANAARTAASARHPDSVSMIDGWLESHGGGVRPSTKERILGR